MKKILLATTVLVGTAGFASAEMTLSGSAVMGVGSDGENTISKTETYVTFTGAGETDGGLSFGMSSTLATYNPDDAQASDGFSNDGTSVFVSGAFGKLTMGNVDEADKVVGLSDIGGINGLGVDNQAEALVGAGNHDVNYTYSSGDLMVAASTRIGQAGGEDSYAVGGKYTFGDYYVALGYNDTEGTSVTSLYAGGTFGAVNVAALYSQDNVDGNDDAYGVYAAYTMDALTISAEYASDDDNTTDDAYGIGAAYDLGGGAKATGGVASVDDVSVWEAGLSFAF